MGQAPGIARRHLFLAAVLAALGLLAWGTTSAAAGLAAGQSTASLTQITDPIGDLYRFGYNDTGQVTSATDAFGRVTQWAYDVEGRATVKTYQDASTLTNAYENTTSRLHSVTDALGQVKQFGYARDDRVTSITYTGAINPTPDVSFTYDPFFPRVTSMTDGTGTTQYAYVPVGTLGALRMQMETTGLTGATISYLYDGLERVSRRTVSGTSFETFGYDAISRLTADTNALGAFTIGYLGETRQIVSRDLTGSSLATTWSYLPNSGDRRLSGVSTAGLTAGQSTGFQYATNAGDQTLGVTQTSDAAIPYPSGALVQTAGHNTLNQLITFRDPATQHLTYDLDGNLVADGVLTYSWDAENRLVAIGYVSQPGKATAFAYDGLGRRVSVSSTPVGGGAATVTSYVWCGGRICQARNAAGAVTRAYFAEGEYVPGPPVQSLYYAPDELGSVRRVFSASAAPSYDYDPYGVPLQGTPPVTDFDYAGTFYNADSGLYLTPHRAYNPSYGRWLSRDPAGEATDAQGNLYVYVGGDPVGASDPSGLIAMGPIALFPFLHAVVCSPHGAALVGGGLLAGAALALAAPETAGASVLAEGGAGALIAEGLAEIAGGATLDTGAAVAVDSGADAGLAAEGAEGVTSLYRAVGPAELEDIQATGAFQNLGSAEGKYFTTSGEAASSYARQAVNAFGDEPYTIVQTNVPNSVLNGMSPESVDGGIPAYVVPNGSLPGLTPNVMNYSPIPGVP